MQPAADASLSCPVPPEQRPLEEYRQLQRSWFFAWAQGNWSGLLKPLALSWLLLLPVAVMVASGSVSLRREPLLLLLAAVVAALMLPLLLLVRQWLGWDYVHRRLRAERISYEESGWYDGQVWEKPLAWRQQDLLVAQHETGPVLSQLRRAAVICASALLVGGGLCQALSRVLLL